MAGFLDIDVKPKAKHSCVENLRTQSVEEVNSTPKQKELSAGYSGGINHGGEEGPGTLGSEQEMVLAGAGVVADTPEVGVRCTGVDNQRRGKAYTQKRKGRIAVLVFFGRLGLLNQEYLLLRLGHFTDLVLAKHIWRWRSFFRVQISSFAQE
ncbi:hypothetical protein L6164_026246 [Bauhinia variegata]|uniref:Uncharacterized protein n=1 Tax=Bauhinia variegata TaxID=167791 RepID=A0ACB9LP91_BAUVA|nr:hypothetical protein L6164_026246 [Bauhinia variegata]